MKRLHRVKLIKRLRPQARAVRLRAGRFGGTAFGWRFRAQRLPRRSFRGACEAEAGAWRTCRGPTRAKLIKRLRPQARAVGPSAQRGGEHEEAPPSEVD